MLQGDKLIYFIQNRPQDCVRRQTAINKQKSYKK